FHVLRDGQSLVVPVTPKLDAQAGYAVIGVTPWAEIVRLGPLDGAAAGLEQAGLSTVQQLEFLWGKLVGKQAGRLSGLPGIVKLIVNYAQKGARDLLQLMAGLS